ncbi:hypothetical protein FDE98_19715 [Clostridium sporogenes]|uniref:Uncharacterized protein n=1 Tax=Clostridium sporogenes TaxID=1509 RepID=A0A7X5PC73_CLOSG|nr:hypothetical protein [Clostridium sporogenes]AJD29065.1 hypothetical protein T258_4001 [Clostridium botulinum Prevot_594]NFL98554.1 hypothetical protein [Clostridium botulinum]NFP55490.1 hypothetical protein [Clostridium botulinum]NFQ18443.1 hypothetical protein [Clostridium sporogenes]NFQ21046.1 hypothetical protein [Clostridium sporogenes]
MNKRKVRYKNGEWQDFWFKGKRNPCGCGSNIFHEELLINGKVIGVCNACNEGIYEFNYTKEEIKK